MATLMVWARSAALMPVVTPWRASMLTVKAVPERRAAAPGRRIIGSSRRLDLLLLEREADEAAAVGGHEVDVLGRDGLGRHAEVALVLAVLVVDEDDHAARRGSRRWRRGRGRAAADRCLECWGTCLDIIAASLSRSIQAADLSPDPCSAFAVGRLAARPRAGLEQTRDVAREKVDLDVDGLAAEVRRATSPAACADDDDVDVGLRDRRGRR